MQNLQKRYDKIVIDEAKYLAHKKIPKEIIKNLNKKKINILDLGCGTGLSSIEFFKKKYNVTGIDISKEMINIAKKYPYQRLIIQDIEKRLKVKNNYFDVISLIGVTEFINNPKKLFLQINQKLKPNGIFGLSIPNKISKKSRLSYRKNYYKKEIEALFKETGFKIINKEDFLGYKHKFTQENIKYTGYILMKKNCIK